MRLRNPRAAARQMERRDHAGREPERRQWQEDRDEAAQQVEQRGRRPRALDERLLLLARRLADQHAEHAIQHQSPEREDRPPTVERERKRTGEDRIEETERGDPHDTRAARPATDRDAAEERGGMNDDELE